MENLVEVPDPVRTFLADPRVAVVATLRPNGRPHLTLVWYEMTGDGLVFNTKEGRVNERNLRGNSRIAVCVEEGYRYVTFEGRATVDYDTARGHQDIRRLAIRYLGKEKGEKSFKEVFSKEKRISVRVLIERVYTYGF